MLITRSDIDGGKSFDWGRVSEDYAKYRDIYPPAFYENIIKTGLCVKGQRVLDIGTGTGVLPRNLYKYGAQFTASDISENQIRYARLLSEQAGMDIEYVVSPAEELSFPDGTFDVVTACQCYIYFNKSALFPKIHSLLKPGGSFCILFMMWLPEESDIAGETERIVLRHNPGWTDHSAKRFTYEFPEEAREFFELGGTFGYDLPVRFTRELWNKRITTCRGIGASLSREEVAAFESEHLEYLAGVPDEFDIPHFVTGINLKKSQRFFTVPAATFVTNTVESVTTKDLGISKEQ